MQVTVDREKLGELLRAAEREVDFNALKFHVRELMDLVRGNPFDNLLEFRAAAGETAALILAAMVSFDKAAEILKEADPSTATGMLKLEAMTQLLDDALQFGGLMGAVAEHFDDDAIRSVLCLIVAGLNRVLGEDWRYKIKPPEA